MSFDRSKPEFSPRAAVRELIWYGLGAFLSFGLICGWGARHGGLPRNPWLMPLGMFTPMLSAVIVQKLARRPIVGPDGLGFRLGRLRYWVLAPAGCAILIILATPMSFLITPSLMASGSEVVTNTGRLRLPAEDLGLTLTLLLAFTLTLLVGPVLNLPIFLGEEVGWRGFMNPRLIALGGRRGLVVGGAIWAFWHVPVILLGHNYPAHPWLGLLVWVPICVCLNILLEVARQRGGSIVPPALAHGIINQTAMLMLVLFMREDRFVDLLHGPAGLCGLVVLAWPAVWLYRQFDTNTGQLPPASLVGRERADLD